MSSDDPRDWFDIRWCDPCREGRHEDCRPVPWCACWTELQHDEEMTMPHEARACRAALNQANVRWPGRLKASDGILSSDAHKKQNPTSDHDLGNAVDVTHCPAGGPNCADEAIRLVGLAKAGKAPWLKYIIFNKRIASAAKGWAWRRYDGANPHTKHMHISINAAYRDADIDWWDRPTPVTPKDDDMTPEQHERLKNIEKILVALVAPRLPGGKDRNPGEVDLGDILTKIENDK